MRAARGETSQMGDTVRLRPNHYQTLGLTPAASGQEIAQAFAKQLT